MRGDSADSHRWDSIPHILHEAYTNPLFQQNHSTTHHVMEADSSNLRTCDDHADHACYDHASPLSSRFFELAAKKGCTPAQLALAWVLACGPDVVPIPGSKSAIRIEENAKATEITLTPDECAEIEAVAPLAVGDRYEGMSGTFNQRM